MNTQHNVNKILKEAATAKALLIRNIPCIFVKM